jgi:hypothetical protein
VQTLISRWIGCLSPLSRIQQLFQSLQPKLRSNISKRLEIALFNKATMHDLPNVQNMGDHGKVREGYSDRGAIRVTAMPLVPSSPPGPASCEIDIQARSGGRREAFSLMPCVGRVLSCIWAGAEDR